MWTWTAVSAWPEMHKTEDAYAVVRSCAAKTAREAQPFVRPSVGELEAHSVIICYSSDWSRHSVEDCHLTVLACVEAGLELAMQLSVD